MDMEDVDDPMEIEEPVPVTPIIERRSDAESTEIMTAVASITTGSESKTSKDTDVVVLDDDDEDVAGNDKSQSNTTGETIKDIIDLVDKPKSSRCLNTNCSGENRQFLSAPDFCLSYFRMKKSKSAKEEICQTCYDQAVQDYDKLATALKHGKCLFDVELPIMNETLQIDDSDEDDDSEDMDDVDYSSDENFHFVSENINDVLMKTMQEFGIQEQMKKEREFLKNEAAKLEAETNDLTGKVKEIRTVLDKIQIDLYNQFRPDIQSLNGINIYDDTRVYSSIVVKPDLLVSEPNEARKSTRQHKPVNYVDFLDDAGNSNSPKVLTPPSEKPPSPVPPENRVEIPKDLPSRTFVDKPSPIVGEIYYITRDTNLGSWIRARLQGIIQPKTSFKGIMYSTTHYRLVELKQQKERILDGKTIAYMSPTVSLLAVGTRVISAFKELSDTGEVKKVRNIPYYAGIVGETPVESNNYRYLVFFDIGYSQYVHHSSINLVFEVSPNVWEDMPADSRPFIKKYLESQDRPMVKLAVNQTVRVEYNGKWRLCSVTAVDCSLVQVFFDVLNRTEWIYRGSTRLSPMYREEQAATNRHIGHTRASRKIGPTEAGTVIQYTRNNDFVQNQQETSPNVRAVARKSTTKPNANIPPPNIVPFLPQVNNTPTNVTGPTSKIMYFTPRDQAVIRREYKPHECGIGCKAYLTHNFAKLRGHNPLSKPLLCGWARMTLKDRGRKEIIYKAPCGRMIRNISEIHYYLRQSQSEMTVDLFDFNHMVRCLAEFSVECTPDPKDLSRGLEQVPIPVINGFNNEMLDFCNYSTKRVPMEDVHLNLDPDFLCGCDCEDDCIDKTKCACWKMTLEGVKYMGKDVDPISVGYIYKRLQEQVITGIYECNSRCKCNSTCLNRVVQNPLSLKLQVFRTHNRGWGIRCLNDIPQGTFICIYAGTLHTEQMANEDGLEYGDEYFAELDYIETVEKYKEDYEEEAMEEEEYKEKSPLLEDEVEEDEVIEQRRGSRNYGKRYMDDNDFLPSKESRITKNSKDEGVKLRLRKRRDEEQNKRDSDKVRVKKELHEASQRDVKAIAESLSKDIDTVTISDDEDEGREVLSFNPKTNTDLDEKGNKYRTVREVFGANEKDNIYIMDAKNAGNIGRFLNHSCSPNVFVQNVFVDTHDPRFPWVAFFSSQFIRAGTELTWNYNYDIGSVPGRVLYCYCASLECKGRLL